MAEYVVEAARADKNLCLGKTEKKKKSKHYFCCCHCSVVRRGKPESVPSEEIVSFSTLLSGCCWGKTQERLTQSVGFDLKRERLLGRGGTSYVNMSSMDKGLERLTSLEKVWPLG